MKFPTYDEIAKEIAEKALDEFVINDKPLREWIRIMAEQQPRWIPVKFRPLTEEEQEEYPDYCYMADCPMPDDGEEILVTTTHGYVNKDISYFDDGFCLDSGYDWQTDVIAWMPLPEPYKEDSDGS